MCLEVGPRTEENKVEREAKLLGAMMTSGICFDEFADICPQPKKKSDEYVKGKPFGGRKK
jgi:hypothetical protein